VISTLSLHLVVLYCVFFCSDTATTEIYTLSLHDALPIWSWPGGANLCKRAFGGSRTRACRPQTESPARQSEESSYEEAPLPGAAAGPGAVGSRETASQLDDGPFRWPLERSMASVRGKWGGGPP